VVLVARYAFRSPAVRRILRGLKVRTVFLATGGVHGYDGRAGSWQMGVDRVGVSSRRWAGQLAGEGTGGGA
jgi:hypothetical protein